MLRKLNEFLSLFSYETAELNFWGAGGYRVPEVIEGK